MFNPCQAVPCQICQCKRNVAAILSIGACAKYAAPSCETTLAVSALQPTGWQLHNYSVTSTSVQCRPIRAKLARRSTGSLNGRVYTLILEVGLDEHRSESPSTATLLSPFGSVVNSRFYIIRLALLVPKAKLFM